MSIDVYRSVDGLGTRCTGQRVIFTAPFVEYDQVQGVRIDYIEANPKIYPLYRLDYDADTTEATLVSIDYIGAVRSSTPVALAIDTQTPLSVSGCAALVTRTATASTGSLQFRGVVIANNDIGQSDQTDPSGAVTYRCVFLYNNSASTISITGIRCWDLAMTGTTLDWETAIEATPGETTQTITDETTAPSGLSFSSNITYGSPIALPADAVIPLWIKRNAIETAGEHGAYITVYAGIAATFKMLGSYVTSLTSIPPYYGYTVFDPAGGGATTIDNSDDVAAPVEIAALPYTVDIGAIQDAAHASAIDDFILRVGVRAVTTAGAQSQNQLLDYALHLNYTTGDITAPNAPVIDTVEYLDGGQVRVVVDHDQTECTTRAVKLVATIGAESITKLLNLYEDVTETEFVFQTPVTWNTSVTVSVVAIDADNRESAADTDTGTAIFEYGESAGWNFAPASLTGAAPDYAEFASTESFGDVDIIAAAGMTSISLNGTSVITAQTAPHASIRLHTLALTGGTITAGACSDPIEPVSTTVCYLCAGGSRVAKVDLTAGTLTCPVFNDTALLDCPLAGPYQEIGNYVYWQYLDVATNRWKPFMIIDKTNTTIHFVKNLECI